MFGLPEGEDLNWVGQLFLLAGYGFILFRAAVFIGDGSEKLLLLYGPGVIGGLVIPILGAVPDGAIVLVSGLGPDAQQQISVGVGTLAGSTIMLLTLPWAGSVILGARDYDAATRKAALTQRGKPKFTNGLSLADSCVTASSNVPFGAKVMMVTSISYLIVAIPAAINKNKPDAAQLEHLPALVGLIVCAVAFFGYSIYQVYSSSANQTAAQKAARKRYENWRRQIGKVFGTTKNAARVLFDRFDKDKNGTVDRDELYQGLVSLGLEVDRNQVMEIMKDINTDDDEDTLTFDEFNAAIGKWAPTLAPKGGFAPATVKRGLSELSLFVAKSPKFGAAERSRARSHQPQGSAALKKMDRTGAQQPLDERTELLAKGSAAAGGYQAVCEEKQKEHAMLSLETEWMEAEDEFEDLELEKSNAQVLCDAMCMLCFGTLLCVIFSDPMVAVISNFSNTITVPAFYVSFIVTPIASNAAEIYSSLIFAAKKTEEGVSMGFSALYGAACMNNTFVLCIFCVLIYVQELKWTFMVETLVILLTIIVVGINGMKETIFVWQAIPVVLMFPLSLLLVALLNKPLDD